MSRTRVFAARIGDGGLLDGIREIFGSEAFQDFITGLLENWITSCALPASGRDARLQATEEYNGETYEPRFLRRATRSVQKHRRKKRLPRLTADNAEQIAIVLLDAIRGGDEEEMTLGIHDC